MPFPLRGGRLTAESFAALYLECEYSDTIPEDNADFLDLQPKSFLDCLLLLLWYINSMSKDLLYDLVAQ